jgi:hypothetical protein
MAECGASLQTSIARTALPLGVGIVYNPFAGSGSMLAAAETLGYRALGTDSDQQYFAMAKQVFGPLSLLQIADKNEKLAKIGPSLTVLRRSHTLGNSLEAA